MRYLASPHLTVSLCVYHGGAPTPRVLCSRRWRTHGPLGEGADRCSRGGCAPPMLNMSPALRAVAESRQGRPKIAHGFNRGSQWKKVRAPEGRKRMLTAQPGSAVPDGTLPDFTPIPTDESVGYFLSPYWAGARSKSCSIYSLAPINLPLSCAPTKLVPTPRPGVCVKITQPPFALLPPVPS